MNKQTHPTYVGEVFDHLVKIDDFANVDALCAALPGISRHHVIRSLHHLRKHKAIDAVEVDGVLWWMASPHTDTRTRQLKKMAEHTRKSSNRKDFRKQSSVVRVRKTVTKSAA